MSTKASGPKDVLRGVNLEVETGQSLVVIGGSGSGKSVMLKSILGLLTPDSGSIKIDNRETVGLPRRGRADIDHQIGMLFQNGALFDSLPVWKNVAFRAIQNDGMNEADARDLAVDALKRVELGAELLDLSPAALSGGMHKRVGLARAYCLKAGDYLLRRTDHRPRPDYDRCHQSSYSKLRAGPWRNHCHNHP
jgi:phospholipid/cholesterol/gamma-HCH transport system ATP-binding protein